MSKLAKALTAAAGNAGESLYVEDVFSTYLYTGTGATQTITNGIDLDGEGGLVWIKQRDGGFTTHNLYDTERGANNRLDSSTTSAEATPSPADLASFYTSGFTLGTNGTSNASGGNYASWTFRKAEKFFDVVTYTGDGVAGRTVAHNLGSVPGMVIVKRTDSTAGWFCWNRNLANNQIIRLDSTDAAAGPVTIWNNTAPTSTVFSVGNDIEVNASGGTYVAYLFAHDAGGFGDDGSESIIKCGSYTGDGVSGNEITGLGWEPQWLMVKRAGSGGTGNWFMVDTMRGIVTAGAEPYLFADTSNAELGPSAIFDVTPDGFIVTETAAALNASGVGYIYIAIRRGPMKTPESGTEVFSPITYSGDATANRVITGLMNSPDWILYSSRNAAGQANHITGSRLQGGSKYLLTEGTSAETSSTLYGVQTYGQTSVTLGSATTNEQNASGVNYILYGLRRAPGFFDVVAYTGNSVAGRTVAHNLGVAPEMMIVKNRNAGVNWIVYHKDLDSTSPQDKYLILNEISATQDTALIPWNDTAPTSSVFTVSSYAGVNESPSTYIAYLFATLAGVSKVGSYTGTAADLNVDCGFSAGARFILIKRSDSTGDWYVWDSARGIVAGDDPYLLLNSTAAEVTNTDYIDPLSSGFTVTSNASGTVNVSGGTYIFLAIA